MNIQFESIEKISAPQQVAQQLKNAIFSGSIPSGSKLPSERELAAQMGVSRPVLREAIVMLSSYGLISSKQGEGTFIVDNFSNNVISFLGFDSNLNRDNYLYCFHCREVIETGMVDFAIQHITSSNIKKINEINNSLLEQKDHSSVVEKEIEFHRYLVSLAKNPLLLELYSIVLKFVHSSAAVLLQVSEVQEEAFHAHKEIINALEAKDGERCRFAITKHLHTASGNMARYYKSQQ